MNEQYAAIITSLPLFKGYTSHGAQRLLECGEVKEHAPGELLFSEGDQPTSVLLILTGELQVFVERQGRSVVLKNEGPGKIVGELAVLCGIPRSASVRVGEQSTVLQWEASAFRNLLLGDVFLSEKIFRESLRALIETEQSLITSLANSQDSHNQSERSGSASMSK
jgi:CRP-like cAMP-binding protein